MATTEVKNLKNDVVGNLDLSDKVFDYSASDSLVWEAVRAFQASQRKGTHATKNRMDVRGGGRKPWKQKGTGRARVGSIRSPLWRGGGTVFGPSPRDYSQALPKKKRRGAMRLVLTDKLRDGRLIVVEDWELSSPRTREFMEAFKGLGLEGKVLVIDSRENRNLYLSTRNLPKVTMVPSDGVNIVNLLEHGHVVISKSAVLEMQEVLER